MSLGLYSVLHWNPWKILAKQAVRKKKVFTVYHLGVLLKYLSISIGYHHCAMLISLCSHEMSLPFIVLQS